MRIALGQRLGQRAGQVHNLRLHALNLRTHLRQFHLGLHPGVELGAGIPTVGIGVSSASLVDGGRKVNAACLMAAVVDAFGVACLLQRRVGRLGPGFALFLHQGRVVPIATLGAKAFGLHIAQR